MTSVRRGLLLSGICCHFCRHSAESTGAPPRQRAKPGKLFASMTAACGWQAVYS